MSKKNFLTLIDRYLTHQASASEVLLLDEYYYRMERKGQALPSFTPDGAALKSKLMQKITGPVEKPAYSLKWLAVAASIVLAITAAFFFRERTALHLKIRDDHTAISAKKIIPGGNKATLKLSNGSVINLTEASNGMISKQQGVEIKKDKDGHLVYIVSKTDATDANNEPTYNTIETPKGGQYQIRLPDGTNVWLNAASSLKYPTQFRDRSRRVTLTGEAYFEVAKNPDSPFIVTTDKQVIEVYGTHFNVNAYDDEEISKTTLLEGSIKVSIKDRSSMLRPGQQCRVRDGHLEIGQADISTVTDWKTGYFILRETNIQEIMRKVARWYNIDIDYSGNLEGLHFTGKVSRSKDLSEILKVLTLTGDVNFKIEGGRITVMR